MDSVKTAQQKEQHRCRCLLSGMLPILNATISSNNTQRIMQQCALAQHNNILYTHCGFLRYSSIVYCPKNTHRFDCSRNIFQNYNHMNTHRFLLWLLNKHHKNCGKPTDQLHQLRKSCHHIKISYES